MFKYLLKRIGQSILTLFIILTVVFIMVRQMPIDGYFESIEKLDEAVIKATLDDMGLNNPLPVQLKDFFVDLFHGDLGTSTRYSKDRPITQIIAEKAPISIQMGVLSMALSMVLGIPLGAAMARSKSKFWDKFGTVFIVLVNAVPSAVYYIYLQSYGSTPSGVILLMGLVAVAASVSFCVLLRFLMNLGKKEFGEKYGTPFIVLAANVIQTAVYYLYIKSYCNVSFLSCLMMFSLAHAISMALCIPVWLILKRHNRNLWKKVGVLFIVLAVNIVQSIISHIYLNDHYSASLGVSMLFNKSNWISWILPVFSMSLGNIAYYAMWLRRYMLDEMNKDYVRLARAKGVDSQKITMRHVFRNAFVPMIQYIPTSLLYTVGGSIYIESLYSIPGMGGLLVDVITRQDNPMVQAIVMIYSCIGIVGMLLGDLLMAIIDPRISLTRKEGAR